MREDHLIDAPLDYAYRLRAGAGNCALGGWCVALAIVFSMITLPSAQTMPLVRTGMVISMLVYTGAAFLLWAKGQWRLSDARIEALPTRTDTTVANTERALLVMSVFAVAGWLLVSMLRAISTDTDPAFAQILINARPPIVPIVATGVIAGVWLCAQRLAYALRERTAPAKPGVFAFPLTLATLPVGLVTLPGAMQTPSFLAFLTMGLAIAFAFSGAQGAILRHRVSRVIRERRRAEVIATR